jgi:RNA polymerase sigma-70 factor, ECF subfamily
MNKSIQNIWLDLHQELRKFIYKKVQDTEISNDILQDVFIKIQLHIHTLNDASKLTSWVYQITRNTIIDYFRNQKKTEPISFIDFSEHEEQSFQELADCINSKINNLPQKYKEAFILTTLKDFSQIELAEHLGISYSGAKSRVQRAKLKLKEYVADCENVQTDSLGNIIDYDPLIR